MIYKFGRTCSDFSITCRTFYYSMSVACKIEGNDKDFLLARQQDYCKAIEQKMDDIYNSVEQNSSINWGVELIPAAIIGGFCSFSVLAFNFD